jgi:hypothetical protein
MPPAMNGMPPKNILLYGLGAAMQLDVLVRAAKQGQ